MLQAEGMVECLGDLLELEEVRPGSREPRGKRINAHIGIVWVSISWYGILDLFQYQFGRMDWEVLKREKALLGSL
jgi:hypothetical protein